MSSLPPQGEDVALLLVFVLGGLGALLNSLPESSRLCALAVWLPFFLAPFVWMAWMQRGRKSS